MRDRTLSRRGFQEEAGMKVHQNGRRFWGLNQAPEFLRVAAVIHGCGPWTLPSVEVPEGAASGSGSSSFLFLKTCHHVP